MGTAFYLLIRFALWTAGVVIAMTPSLMHLGAADLGWPTTIARTIDARGQFRDMLFIIVPAAAVSLSTTFEFLCTTFSRGASDTTRLAIIFGIVVNVIILVLGFVGFVLIPVQTKPLDPTSFSVWGWFLTVGLVLSLLTEIAVSWAHFVRRRQRHESATRWRNKAVN